MKEITAYSIYDTKAEVYDTPVFFLNEVTAKRWFYTLVQKGEGRFEFFTDEMELVQVCKFNVLTGMIIEAQPKKIIEGKQIGKEIKNNANRNAA